MELESYSQLVTPRDRSLPVRRTDWLGRRVGLAVFCLGIAGLGVVFVMASRLTGPSLPAGKLPDTNWAVSFGVEIVRLFVSGMIASWAAGRGAQLYAAANRGTAGD